MAESKLTDLIAKLEAATDIIKRARIYIGNPSDHPSSRQSPRNELVGDMDEFLAALQLQGGSEQ